MSSIYILSINLLSHIYWKYFLPFHSVNFPILPFHTVDFSFALQKFFVWYVLTYLCMLLVLVLLMSYPRNQCQNKCHKAFPLCLPLGILQLDIFLSLYFDLLTVYGVKRRVQFHSISCIYPVFPDSCSIMTENQETTYVWIYFWALNFVPLVYRSVFCPVSYSFNYCTFVICFKNREVCVLKLCSSLSRLF